MSLSFVRYNCFQQRGKNYDYFHLRFRPNDATQVPIEDSELLLHDHLKSSESAVDELLSHGSAVLEQIRAQGLGLRGIKRKVLDIGQEVSDPFTAKRNFRISLINLVHILTQRQNASTVLPVTFQVLP